MEPWLSTAKIYSVILFFVLQLLTRYGFGFYIGRKTAQGLAAQLVPLKQTPLFYRGLSLVAVVASFFMYAYALIFVVYPDIENYYLPVPFLQDNRIAILGIVFVALGMLTYVSSEVQLGLSYHEQAPEGYTRLVTSGVYAYSRNPLSMGLFFALFGIFLISPNWIFLLCWLIYVLNEHFKVTLLEEPFLTQTFGAAYRDYCQKVNRYF